MRFLAAQFAGLLENDIWLANATQANLMAQRLSAGLRDIPGVTQPTQSNPMPFSPTWTRASSSRCSASGASTSGTQNVVRLMTAFDTTPADVDALLASVREVALSRV